MTIKTLSSRPKIGVALSGGGAKGLAHIGVLKVLEEAGIYPDIVTGTSMGSLVGGLYAIGYTPKEMEDVINRVNWDEILTNKISLDRITFEEKQYYNRYMFELPMQGFKIGIPRGAIEGQKLSELFSNLTRSAHGISDFSQFPRPYANVATDIVTGKHHVMRSGSLPETMRASMAIPSIFSPMIIDGRLLVDGGLVHNFPVQEALDLGADIVIGVNVSEGNLDQDKLVSMVDILVQSAFFISAFDTELEKKKCRLLIEPNLTNFSTGSFKSSEAIIAEGEKSARAMLPQILALADSLNMFGATQKVVKKLPSTDRFHIEKINITGNSQIPPKFIRGKFKIQEGDTISYTEIEKEIEILYGRGYFDKITYEVIPTPQKGAFELTLKVKESTGKILKVAAFFDVENGAGLTLNLTNRNFVFSNSRFLAEGDIAENPRLDLNYLRYLGLRQNVAWMVGYQFLQTELPGFTPPSNRNYLLSNQWQQFYGRLQTTFAKDIAFGLEYSRRYLKQATLVSGTIELPTLEETPFDLDWMDRLRHRSNRAGFFLNVNTLNRPFLPTKGWKLDASAGLSWGIRAEFELSDAFSQETDAETREAIQLANQDLLPYNSLEDYRLSILRFFPVSKVVSMKLALEGAHLSRKELFLTDELYVGGFRPVKLNSASFWGAELYQNTLTAYGIASWAWQWQPIDNVFFTGQYQFLRGHGDGSGAIEGWGNRHGAGIQAAYYSTVGPVTFGMAKASEHPGLRYYFGIGFTMW